MRSEIIVNDLDLAKYDKKYVAIESGDIVSIIYKHERYITRYEKSIKKESRHRFAILERSLTLEVSKEQEDTLHAGDIVETTVGNRVEIIGVCDITINVNDIKIYKEEV